jgi:hypothetical protein
LAKYHRQNIIGEMAQIFRIAVQSLAARFAAGNYNAISALSDRRRFGDKGTPGMLLEFEFRFPKYFGLVHIRYFILAILDERKRRSDFSTARRTGVKFLASAVSAYPILAALSRTKGPETARW